MLKIVSAAGLLFLCVAGSCVTLDCGNVDWTFERAAGPLERLTTPFGRALSRFPSRLDGDSCATARPIIQAMSLVVNTTAPYARGPTACASAMTSGEWFQFTPTQSGNYVVTTCTGNTTENTFVEVYTGCSSTSCLNSNDDGGVMNACYATDSAATFVGSAGVPYYMLVRTVGAPSGGHAEVMILWCSSCSSTDYVATCHGMWTSDRTCSACTACPSGFYMSSCWGAGSDHRTCIASGGGVYTSYTSGGVFYAYTGGAAYGASQSFDSFSAAVQSQKTLSYALGFGIGLGFPCLLFIIAIVYKLCRDRTLPPKWNPGKRFSKKPKPDKKGKPASDESMVENASDEPSGDPEEDEFTSEV